MTENHDLAPPRPLVVRGHLAHPRSAHLIPVNRRGRKALTALCGQQPVDYWRGAGSPENIARAQNLPLCRTCVRLLTAWTAA